MRSTSACVMTVRFGRDNAGRRKALVACQRTPRFWFIWKKALPKLSPRLNSRIFGMPHSSAASRQASRISQRRRESSTRSSPPDAVHLVGAVLIVLDLLEQRQHVVPRPSRVAERRPVVVVLLLAAHVDHGVDRGAAAEHLAARVVDRSAGEVLVGLRSCSTSRCAGWRWCRDSRPGCRSRTSRPARRLRGAAPAWRDSQTAGLPGRSRRSRRRR